MFAVSILEFCPVNKRVHFYLNFGHKTLKSMGKIVKKLFSKRKKLTNGKWGRVLKM